MPELPMPAAVLEARHLNVSAGSRLLLRDVNLRIPSRGAVALIGPSGVGKSTLLRCFNRFVDLTPGIHVAGEVLFRGESTRAQGADADFLRARVGMLFQQPVVFPTSILGNVLFGIRRQPAARLVPLPELAERMLRETCLWEEVKDRLGAPAQTLSIGQQQRLSLARALALAPEVILMDEPTSSLDPRSASAIEDLVLRLKTTFAVVLVTHDLGQARRVADHVARLQPRGQAGEITALGPTGEVLHGQDLPSKPRPPTLVELNPTT